MNLVNLAKVYSEPRKFFEYLYRTQLFSAGVFADPHFESLISALMQNVGYHEHLRLWRIYAMKLEDNVSAYEDRSYYPDMDGLFFGIDPNVFTWKAWFNHVLYNDTYTIDPYLEFDITFFADRVLIRLYSLGGIQQRILIMPYFYMVGKRRIEEVWPQ